jgi:hypothetical protein
MPVLKSLSFTALPKSGNDPVQTRRANRNDREAAEGCLIELAGDEPSLPGHSAVMLSRLLSVPRKTLGAVLDRLHRDLGAFPPDDLQFFVFKLVSCDEKLLKLLLNRL